jgi:hypothetical protein
MVRRILISIIVCAASFPAFGLIGDRCRPLRDSELALIKATDKKVPNAKCITDLNPTNKTCACYSSSKTYFFCGVAPIKNEICDEKDEYTSSCEVTDTDYCGGNWVYDCAYDNTCDPKTCKKSASKCGTKPEDAGSQKCVTNP